MTVRLDGRVAIVTGAGAGLGREHALLLARLGAKVVVNDLGGGVDGTGNGNAAADKVVEEIKEAGGEAAANYDSVASAEGAERIVKTAQERFGGLHVLVNNAGILRDKSFAKMSMEDFNAVLQVHLLGTTYCTKAAWPVMLEQEYGRIVVTTSIAGTSGNFGQANYGTAKMGMLGLMNCLAIEGRRKNVLINAVSPGANTRMTVGLVAESIVEHMGPQQVSPAVAYLSSELCQDSGHIITAGAGGFGRIHFFETEGVQFNPSKQISADMFAEKYGQISDLKTATPTTPGPAGRLEDRLKLLRSS
ncbi:SDR family NAD(P)-dependent oxidoreductase [Bradyrhizobium sp. 1]|uniref:SDR family NAD(P)-dependent oxidoreductase n=1 Tax=Bradyrhizobium sp. 1 TaxID=241591 RepID=UPI001FFAC51D|nr:SDR family NAD(P)-dependent oxidoreductase [Bradyrhizobium sp. 1]MCK1394462.1 SDR family NAD(P)-dependent oxidoreductase [Bradyrhizobium sp. 1]